MAALQRDLAETPRRSPHKRRQPSSASAAKQRSTASAPFASPTSSVKKIPKSSRKTSETKRKSERNQELRNKRPAETVMQMPMAMSDFLANTAPRRGGFSFNEIREDEIVEENREEKEDRTHMMNTRQARRRESPTFSGRRPVRLVEDVETAAYTGPSEAATRLEALIGARRRRKESYQLSYDPPPPVPARNRAAVPVSAPVEPARISNVDSSLDVKTTVPAASLETSLEHGASLVPKLARQKDRTPIEQQNEQTSIGANEETKESERSEPQTDFQTFCASFASGGSAAAQVATKRKHHEAFESDAEKTNDSVRIARQSVEKRKHPRILEQHIEQPEGNAATATPHPLDKRSHYEAFGSDDEKEIDDAVEALEVLEKRSHDQALGTTKGQERPQEKTPRINRRISFGDEVDALIASPPMGAPGECSTGKRKHKQAFGMLDDEDDDAEWRDSLAFRPH